MNPPATDDLVILVHNGRDIGTANRLHIHTTNTPLHRAFSTYLRRDDGRVLITRR
ncbi:isopentenyl-diphosphate delta-isomerase, partial [Dermatophilus congolensis]|nr:isopentenyl-diphosphate delta-isomerase [Dermatophilus congolensis]MBO3202644.1 isopentenyl-diphosphate delta-isomerase [Dermatophilus congolensis]